MGDDPMKQVWELEIYPTKEALDDNVKMSSVWIEEESLAPVEAGAERLGLFTKRKHVVGYVSTATARTHLAEQAERVFAHAIREAN